MSQSVEQGPVDRGPIADRPRGAPSTRSAVLAGIVTVLVVAAMLNLGLWQLRRHADVAQQNERIAARAGTAVDLGAIELDDPTAHDFQRITTTGHWVPEEEVLWRGRSRNTVTGYEILTPLQLVDDDGAPTGEVLLVDRGWVPDVFDTPPVSEAIPPLGTVEVEGILRTSIEQPGFGPRDPDEGELERVFHADLPRLASQVSGDLVTTYYLRLERAVPAASDEVLRPLAAIEQDAGPHLGYALQWFGFSATAVVAYLAWLRTRVLGRRRERGRSD